MAGKEHDKKTKKVNKAKGRPVSGSRDVAIDIEKAESTAAGMEPPLSIDSLAVEVGEDPQNISQEIFSPDPGAHLLAQMQELDINMPDYPHGAIARVRGVIARNGHKQEGMVRAVVLSDRPRFVDLNARLPLQALIDAGIHPARYKNDWIYPVIIDADGKMRNWPRQQNISLGSSSYILWLARNWPEHKVLNRTEKKWWQTAAGYGIIVVVILIIIVLFLIMFFWITS